MKTTQPTQQDIKVYLNALNRVADSATLTPDTAAVKAHGVELYLAWFKKHGIPIYQERGVWKIREVTDK